jgi:hypothetical protein
MKILNIKKSDADNSVKITTDDGIKTFGLGVTFSVDTNKNPVIIPGFSVADISKTLTGIVTDANTVKTVSDITLPNVSIAPVDTKIAGAVIK